MAASTNDTAAGPPPKGATPTEANTIQPPSLPKGVFIIAAVAALYFGRDIFLPLAIAILLTFALAPLVSMLRKIRIPRPPAVIAVVMGAFIAIALFGMVVATQLGSLASNLPLYQTNIETKVQAIKNAQLGEGIIDRVSRLFERLGREIQSSPPQPAGPAEAEPAVPPMQVEIVEPPAQALQVLQTIIGPLIEPLATGGIIIVVVIFMLLKREDLRDRFIRLVGAGDLHRTTEALQDAGKRVGQYLLMQLVVNLTYAIPIGIGLWLIGIPNALLWGLLALVMRFVPYIGPIIASMFPLALSIAVDPGWSMLAWTAALFVVVELVSNNFVEPWLYGSRTGLSPLAIIVAAVFWTWLWGPLGLLLSTPLTVCLVVLGRHVPQFEFLDVLFGNEPVLEPHQQLYQRLLAGDPDEATDRAEAYLEDHDIAEFYDRVALPALALGEQDRHRGVMGEERRHRVTDSAMTLVANLEDYADEEAEADDEETTEKVKPLVSLSPDDKDEPPVVLPDGAGVSVLCAGGRGELDDVAAAMIGQVMTAQAASVSVVESRSLDSGRVRYLDLAPFDVALVCFLNPDSETNARYIVRRLKRRKPGIRVGVLLLNSAAGGLDQVKRAAEIGCDFVSHGLSGAVSAALTAPVIDPDMPAAPRRSPRRKTPAPKPKVTA